MDEYTVLHRCADAGECGLYFKGEMVAGWRELERHGYTIWYLLHCSQKRLAYIAREVANV